MSLSHKTGRARGFSLMEVMVAVFILAFGMLALAWSMNQLSTTTSQSRSSGVEVLLASEKLEDLNRYGASDPLLAASPSTSLTSDTAGYYDQIQISSGKDLNNAGDIIETTIGSSGGTANYTQIKHSPNGAISVTTTTGTPPASTADMLVFDRRWLIEKDVPLAGVHRVTVWVQLQNAPNGASAVPFQTSMVRP
ncbi:MAG TPA: prepilin-type N-terminal cleavage/methylation domain-containing protein [Candidatus Angelobacter sp.]|nr:prepilin-type N-terminal cleavage/methylation domain-containing protein [Candidatus Angelobacter sp.]